MMGRSRIKYVPPNLLQEIDNIKMQDKLKKDVDAMNKIVEYCRLGRRKKVRGL